MVLSQTTARPGREPWAAAPLGRRSGPSLAALGLGLVAALYTLSFARAFLIPLTFAILLAFLLSPPVRALKRLGLPGALSALLVLVPLVGGIGYGVYRLAAPAAAWVTRAPESLDKVEKRLRKLRRPVEQMNRTAEQVEGMMSAARSPAVAIKEQSLGEMVFDGTQAFLADAVLVCLLLYFLLASGDLFLRKLIRVLPRLQQKRRAVEIARATERQISTYLVTVTLVNVALGAAVAGALYLLGMPTPMLWGVVAGLLNFIPYLGGVVCTAIFGLAAVLQYDDLGRALLVPAAFVVLNFIEGYLLTPLVMSRRLTLNPVVVFVAVLFWGWLWGTVGAFLAVPLVAVLKIACDRIDGLAPVGELLGS